MPKNIVVLGTQWGDEGKGKVVDLLTDQVAAVVRFQGGHNAGHTLVIQQQKTILRLIPSGIFHEHIKCYLGNGVVVAPDALWGEITALESKGIDVQNKLRISEACPLLLPSHVALDKAHEQQKGEQAIGTTCRGIGPVYEDKIARRGLRLIDLYSPAFTEKLGSLLDYHNFILQHYYHSPTLNFDEVLPQMQAVGEQIKPLLADISVLLMQHQRRGDTLLFEGAQGCLLDIDHGTYPFVTSSNTTAGSAASGTGFGPLELDKVFGVAKAYITRVGKGPFPTELTDEIGTQIAEQGHEFGSNTGRPRRCGWLDLVLLKRVVEINSISSLCLTKLDVLDKLAELKLCIGYQYQGQQITQPSLTSNQFADYQPIYKTFSGWQTSTHGMRNAEDLPRQVHDYLEYIQDFVGVPITHLSTGPDRDYMIVF